MSNMAGQRKNVFKGVRAFRGYFGKVFQIQGGTGMP